MTAELEDPRKTELRSRCEVAVEAAGFTVLQQRPLTPWPPDAGLKGALLGDVVGEDGRQHRDHYFVRVDGERALPEWLVSATEASFAMSGVRIIVVAENPGESLSAACAATGTGLARITELNHLELICEYGEPQQDAQATRFRKRARDVRRKMEAKAQLNTRKLEESYQETDAVTKQMAGHRRSAYLEPIENAIVVWRTWNEEMADRISEALASEDAAALDRIEADVLRGPEQ